jgi:hypothetical protein
MPQNNTICTSYPKIVVYKAALSEQEVSDNMTRVRIANIQLDDMNPLGEGEVVLEFIEGKETTINFRGEPAKLTYHAASDKNMSGPGYIDVLWKGTRERIIDKGFFVIW